MKTPMPLRMALAFVLAAAFTGLGAWRDAAFAKKGAPEIDVLDADDPTVSDDIDTTDRDLITGPSDEDLVLAAQKVRTTIQEAPSIITVITARQMRERGFRTINDVLRTVPGFEGDRWDNNGWQKEAFARGLPQTVLVLLNGVNIVEPLRNTVSLDRKIPLEAVERIEVTSGPGGVLWGANALLGIVNIVTKRPDDSGVRAVLGAGDGPGERLALKGGIGVSHRFSDDVGLALHIDMFSSMGAELTEDAEKVIGALPDPAPDSATLYLPGSVTVATNKRAWFFNASGHLDLGPVALDWMIPFEQDYRAIGTGGSNLTHSFLTDEEGKGVVTRSSDSIRMGMLSYADRFANDRLGLHIRGYFVSWELSEDPFGIFAASPIILAQRGHTRDIRIAFDSKEIFRPGGAFDLDWRILDNLTLLFGGEVFQDMVHGVTQSSWVKDTLGTCPSGYTYNAFDAYLHCKITEPQVTDEDRTVGGTFAQLDWRPFPVLALSAGTRLQVSSQFGAALLWSGGAVWKMAQDTHLKLFASSGLRPPSVVSTNVNPNTISGVSYSPNPDLAPETSQSAELELNTSVLRDTGAIRDLFLRINGAFTLLDNVIVRTDGGQFDNSGTRRIASAEAVARLRFEAGHELWANYTFTKVFDDDEPGGELLNFSQHIANLGAKFVFLDDHIELDGILTFKSGMTDYNRPANEFAGRPDYSVSCDTLVANPVAASDPRYAMYQACLFPTLADGIWVMPGQSIAEQIRPLLLLDLGVRFKNIWRDLTVSLFFHNVLDFRYFEPDFFGDERVVSRPQPKPGMSFFGQISLGL